MLDLKKLLATIGIPQDPRGPGYEQSPYAMNATDNVPAITQPGHPTLPAITQPAAPPPVARQLDPSYQAAMPQVQLPTITAPTAATVPAVTPPTAPVVNQPLSLDERQATAQADYNNALTSQEHPNKWLSGLYLALQGISKTFNPHDDSQVRTLADARHADKVGKAQAILSPILEQQKIAQTRKIGDAQIRNYDEDNRRQAQAAEELSDWRKSETNRKIDATVSRERTARMNAVAGMFKNIPSYDPADPKFKELTNALGDVGLPLTPKDAKKHVQLIQDQRSGLWTLTLTDPISGKQEVRNVEKDGKPFASTPTVVMQGEYGMLKQNDQQDFTAQENAKNREALGTYRSAVIGIRQQELDLRKSGDIRGADALKLKHDALKAKALERVRSGQMSQEDFDDIFKEYGDVPLGPGPSITP